MKKLVITLVSVGLILMACPMFAAEGAAVYKAKCAMCHGADGKGKTPLVTPAIAKLSVDDLAKITADGKAPKMPAYKGKLSEEEIKAVAEHIKSLNK